MTQLYQIAAQYNSIQELAESDDENMLVAIADTMEGIESEFQDKAIAIVSMAFNIEADIDAIDAEIKRLNDKKKTIQAKSEWMRDYLKRNMEATGINKIACPLFSITLSAASKQVEITDEAILPDDYVRVKTTVAPDKVAIAKALKEGVDVPGAVLVDDSRRLTIK